MIQPQSQPAVPAGLATVVSRMPGPVFAVVDGGHFDDLERLLSGSGLTARSLFLGEAERDVQRFGPWFVTIKRSQDTEAVLATVGDLPAVVFWSCADGEVALYGHLRRLNMARIPTWAAAGKDGPEEGVAADGGYATALFRHWDPRALGALLPLLDEEQFSRVVGPAQELLFVARDYGGTKRVIADPQWPAAPMGLLTIRSEQIGWLSERRVEAKRQKLGIYLRKATGVELEGMTDNDLRARVITGEASAMRLNIRTEAGQCRWLFLLHCTKGEAERSAPLTTFIRDEGRSPDDQVSLVMKAAAASLQRSGR